MDQAVSMGNRKVERDGGQKSNGMLEFVMYKNVKLVMRDLCSYRHMQLSGDGGTRMASITTNNGRV